MSQRRYVVAAGVAVAAGLIAFLWDDLEPLWRGMLVAVGVFLALVSLFRPRPRDDKESSATEVGLLDKVLSDETRRPWSPTLMPWSPLAAGTVLLVPAADYHLAEVVPLAAELSRRDIPTRVAIGASPWSRTWQALSAYPDLEVHALPDADALGGGVAAVFVMKDTGSLSPFVERCRQLGIPAIGKVEGAQDFWDADTPEERRPYRNLDLVLCQGAFDAEALDDRATAVVGSTRLERLWWAPPVTFGEPLAVINLNFVYGVGSKDRRHWLDSAVAGCEQAGLPYVVSTHPAEKAQIDGVRSTSISASRLLPHASVLISRFSTMPLEAMARGVPFVYHNPHGEQARTFTDPMGAFEVSRSADELAHAIGSLESVADIRSRVAGFFAHHVSVNPTSPSERRSADSLMRIMRGEQ